MDKLVNYTPTFPLPLSARTSVPSLNEQCRRVIIRHHIKVTSLPTELQEQVSSLVMTDEKARALYREKLLSLLFKFFFDLEDKSEFLKLIMTLECRKDSIFHTALQH